MVWAGLGVGLVILAGVYLAIRYLAIRIPTGPFFTATSGLLAVMAVAFAGSGIKELQEGGAVGITPVAGPTIDILGVFPSAETLAAQGAALALVAAGIALGLRKARRAREAAPAGDAAEAGPDGQTHSHSIQQPLDQQLEKAP
jgi:high-affinity iron transporter